MHDPHRSFRIQMITPVTEAPSDRCRSVDGRTRAFPGRELAPLFSPSDENGVYTVWLRPAASTVPARGADAMRTGNIVQTYLVELHNGRLLGLLGEAVILLRGIALTTLPLAGIALWWWRRRRRVRRPDFALLPAE